MISLAAASTIQKIADSRIAIVIMWTNVIFILTNYENYANYSSFLYTYYLILRSSYISIIYKQYIGASVVSVAFVAARRCLPLIHRRSQQSCLSACDQ